MESERQYWHELLLVNGPFHGDQWEVPDQGMLGCDTLALYDDDGIHVYEIHADIGTATFLRTER